MAHISWRAALCDRRNRLRIVERAKKRLAIVRRDFVWRRLLLSNDERRSVDGRVVRLAAGRVNGRRVVERFGDERRFEVLRIVAAFGERAERRHEKVGFWNVERGVLRRMSGDGRAVERALISGRVEIVGAERDSLYKRSIVEGGGARRRVRRLFCVFGRFCRRRAGVHCGRVFRLHETVVDARSVAFLLLFVCGLFELVVAAFQVVRLEKLAVAVRIERELRLDYRLSKRDVVLIADGNAWLLRLSDAELLS